MGHGYINVSRLGAHNRRSIVVYNIRLKGLVSPTFNSFSVKIFNLDNNFDVNHKFEVCTVS